MESACMNILLKSQHMTAIDVHQRKGEKSYCNRSTFIDMTPLVDLGFLLITFFIFTTSMLENRSLKLVMPADNIPITNLGASNALTVMASGGDSLFYYSGTWEDAVKYGMVQNTSYDVKNGLGKIIRDKQKAMGAKKSDLMLIIKPDDRANYNNLINLLDEVLINDVNKYVITALSPNEKMALSY